MSCYRAARLIALLSVLSAVAVPLSLIEAKDPPAGKSTDESPTAVAAGQTAAVVALKPFSANTKKGLEYLIEQQDASGGWGQGGGWRTVSEGGRVEGADVKDPPDLGNTCIATLALIRAGNSPKQGPYAKNVAKAVDFICARVEQADKDSMYVTDVRGTQLQSKIGQYVDTFLAGLVLSELKGNLPDEMEKRVVAALDKTIAKIEKNQQADGTFAGNTGRASVLSQALCSKALNRAAQNDVAVRAEVLKRDSASSVAGLDKKTGEFKSMATMSDPTLVASATGGPLPAGISARTDGPALAGRGVAAAPAVSDAGVHLYLAAGNTARIADQINTNAAVEKQAREVLADAKASQEEKDKAQEEIDRVKDVRAAGDAAIEGIVRKLDDKQFIAGFGNNGGEEFLSYMNISETLAAKGGAEWQTWDKSIAENLNRVQNKDGSWSGDHCITGRTFCTSAALLTLLADRAPVPLAAKIKEQN